MPQMNPYRPPSTSASGPCVSLGAIVILWAGNIGLGCLAAVLCGLSCYIDIAGNAKDDLVAVGIMFGVPFLFFACIGISAGMTQLRRGSKLDQVPTSVYVVALTALTGASLFGNSLLRWFSIFLICCFATMTLSIRLAIRYQCVEDE
ncbi:hypothetical protein ACMFWY_12060 [Roseiconus sp. JC912]|uniref:hypothetical protein n=2 Tax=Pirellulaceae TaxID=2691357 RepID=UPI003A4C64EA